MKGWTKEKRGNSIVFRNDNDQTLTYEIHEFDSRDIETMHPVTELKFYHFPAIKGRSILNSPDYSETIKDATDEAEQYMKSHNEKTGWKKNIYKV
jgi:hypothetical protein